MRSPQHTPESQPGATSLTRFLRLMVGVLSWRVALALALMLAVSLLSGLGTLMLIPLLGLVGLDVASGEVGRLATLLDAGFAWLGLRPTVPAVLGVFVAVMAVTAGLARYQAVLGASLYQAFVLALRQRLYRAILGAEWLFFARQRASVFTHLLTNELERVGAAASALLSLLVRSLLGLIYFGLALFLSPAMTLLVSACGALLALLLSRQTRLGRERGLELSKAYEALHAELGEQLPGLKVIKAHGMERVQVARFGRRSARAAASYLETIRNQEAVGFWLQLGSFATLAAMLYLALEVLALPAATILLLIVLFGRLSPIVTGLQRGYHGLISLLPAVDEVLAMQRRCEAAAEAPATAAPEVRLRRGVRLERVSFAYGDPGLPAVREATLELEAGRTTALVGVSGSGKSTVADLVAGLVEPSEGRVLVDGAPLTGAARAAWRQRLGYVSQEVFLFHDTIRANLAFAAPEAGEAEMWRALSAAAADFVRALPEGLDTVLGDRGVRLSGGERQRLVLARALLRAPEMLILDEATSALDAENERLIQRAIEGLHGEVTLLVIAHRLSSVRHADVIYVLEGGRVLESGSFGQLMADPASRFRALYQAQGAGAAAAAG